jgi:hypothetical protein
MLYEVSSPNDGDTPSQQEEKIRSASRKLLDMAYEGLNEMNLAASNRAGSNLAGSNLAKLIIALRTPDYGPLLPQMLKTLDDAHRTNPHYAGWARHSYDDYLKQSQ